MAETLEELKQQAETYQKLVPTVQGEAQQSLLSAIEATQGKISALENPQPALPAENTLPVASEPMPVAQAPQVSATGQIVNDPRLRPAEEVQQEVQATSPLTPRFEQETQQITPEQADQQGIREVNLASVQSQQPQQMQQLSPQFLTTTQTTIKPGVSIPQELKDTIGKTPSALAELNKVQSKLTNLDTERAGLLQDYQDAIMGFQQQEEARRLKNDAIVEEKLAKYDAAAADIANEKIDSNRWWKNKSTGQKIGTTLAVVLGGLGQGLSGSQTNAAVDAINREIDRDVRDQLQNLNNKKEANKAYMQRIRNVVNDFKSDEARRYAAVNMMLTPMVKKLDGLQQSAQTAVQSANIANIKQGLINTQNQLNIKIKQMEQPQVTKTILSKPTGGIDRTKALKEAREQKKFERESKSLQVTGFQGEARSLDEAKTMRENLRSYNRLEDSVNTIKRLNDKFGSNIPFSEQRAVADTIRGTLKGAMRMLLVGPGAVTETEQKLMDDIIANPTLIFEKNAQARLNALRDIFNKSMRGWAEDQDLQIIDPRFSDGSRGRKYAK